MDFMELIDLAEYGDMEAQFLLAKLYGAGEIAEIEEKVEQDLNQAFYWCLKAAESGHVDAQENVSQMYVRGFGTEKDYDEASYWNTKAASSGSLTAKGRLAVMMIAGISTEKNVSAGIKILRDVAASGNVEAAMQLGSFYLDGKEVTKDLEEAKLWLKKAAKTQHEITGHAQYNLGVLYLQNQNSRDDLGKAYKWLYASVKKQVGYSEFAQNIMRQIENHLTQAEIMTAKKKAKKYY